MVGDHEVSGGLSIGRLRGSDKIERICPLVEIARKIKQVVLEVAAELHVARSTGVTLGDATSVTRDERLLQVAHVHRGIPQCTHGDSTLLGNCHLRYVFPLEVKRTVLHIAWS